MTMQLVGHNIAITPALEELIKKKFSYLYRQHYEQILSLHILLSVDKNSQQAEATVHIPKTQIFAKATSRDMYKTIDLLVKKLAHQLAKHRDKSRSHV